MLVQSLDHGDPLEEERATHSSILAWRIPWTEEPGRIQSMESHKCWTRLKRLSSSSSRTVAHQTPLSMEFSRQEYWSGLLFPPPGDLPNPGIKPKSPASSALQADLSPLSHCGSPTLKIFKGTCKSCLHYMALYSL